MHSALTNIVSELDQLAAQITGSVPAGQPFGIAHGNWSFPQTTAEELRERVEEIAREIRLRGKDVLDPSVEARLNDYPRRIGFLRGNTIPNLWGNSQLGVGALNDSLDSLERAIKPALNTDGAEDAKLRLARIRNQVSALETRLGSLQPKAMSLEEMVRAIEETYSASLELPLSLQEVQEAKQSVAKSLADANVQSAKVHDAVREANEQIEALRELSRQGKEYIEGCEDAYSVSVAKGLSSAFQERSGKLSNSMWLWVVGLVGSLASGVYWGGIRVEALAANAHSQMATTSTIALDAVIAGISVAAPVWFAWLSTRQIGHTFRLSEDYAYKASVARSYEGYRKQAKSVNDMLVEQLLSSAIRRVDEQPLRVVGHESPGSPLQDLAASPIVQRAMNAFPDFANQVRELAKDVLKRSPSMGQFDNGETK